jgi:hypothetical protein
MKPRINKREKNINARAPPKNKIKTANTHRFVLKKTWPPSKLVKNESIGPDGSMPCNVSTRIFVEKLASNKKSNAKKRIKKDNK